MLGRTCATLLCLAGCDRAFLGERVPPAAFSEPILLDEGPVNSPATEEDDPSLTGDLLELYFLRQGDLFRATRADASMPWSAPMPVVELNTAGTELRPSVSENGLTIYFSRGPLGDRDIFVSTRPSRTATWSPPDRLALDLNQPGSDELAGWSSPDGLTLLVESSVGGSHDLYLATRAAVGESFTSAPFAELNSSSNDGAAWATPDGRAIVFESNRTQTTAIWEANLEDDVWYLHHHVELDTARTDGTPWLSPDGNVIVFSRTTTTDDLYLATR
ncbi:MAG: PD40 domain-containing protein [Deltaproteobacteria bacterium]|nr:PD40 domain-containing protein [Deltaproteobacteria bacterium]